VVLANVVSLHIGEDEVGSIHPVRKRINDHVSALIQDTNMLPEKYCPVVQTGNVAGGVISMFNVLLDANVHVFHDASCA